MFWKSDVSMTMFLSLYIAKNTILLLAMRNFIVARSDLVPSEVNCRIFTEDSKIQIVTSLPEKEVSEGSHKELTVMSFICSFLWCNYKCC